MARRFNFKYDRKTPKPHARARTWSRWRMYRNIDNKQDEARIARRDEVRSKLAEKIMWLKNLGKQKTSLGFR